MAPKIDTSTASGSVQKLRNARGSTQPGRYEQLRVARGRILAAKEAKKAKAKAKKARSTRQAHTARQVSTASSDSDSLELLLSSNSNTTLSPIAPVTAEKHARKTSVIWQHMSQKEVNGRKQTICKYCGVNWFLGGSTSNALRHLKVNHPDKLTECNAPTTKASGGNYKKT